MLIFSVILQPHHRAGSKTMWAQTCRILLLPLLPTPWGINAEKGEEAKVRNEAS